ncbi:zinc finger protein 70-like [Mercenaria mercenaria]|uniref:zinc finger protein 70-like n=1 Tax=Mercenaria mercenaria TaxID=6596 RepID=UPI00234EB867|nr:zinc finger protein 70-like [Mercenaria mercenaria]
MDQNSAQVCRFCGKVLSNKSALRQHEAVHTGLGRYQCCEKVFHSKSNLTRHRCTKHDEVRTFVCVECHKAFPTNADLTRHKKREKKIGLKCDICGVTVAGKTDLQEHLDSHSGKKNHRCEECGRVYRYRRNLSRHMKSHKKD